MLNLKNAVEPITNKVKITQNSSNLQQFSHSHNDSTAFFRLTHFFIFLLLVLANQFAYCMAEVTKVRIWNSPDKTRIVFEIADKINYKVYQLHMPERIVLDLINSSLNDITLKNLNTSKLIISSRSSKKNNTLSIILQMEQSVSYNAFLLKPGQGYQHRLVLDIFPHSDSDNTTLASQPIKIIPHNSINTSVKYLSPRDIIVAIDAGHGGEDPGAIGRRGTKEKQIVFSIAKSLAKKVNEIKGMKAILIRQGDYYVSLRGRTQIARKANADVFISIHADAFRDRTARGSSVFILSEKGATSESARWLANKENSADMAGGVSLDDKDDLLARVLLDLSQTASIEGSNSVAKTVLKGLKTIGKTHKKNVERAGFVVLKSPDIPSILVETGFISNPYEEDLLRKLSYQKKVANAIFLGIIDYFKRYPIPGTIYGQHIVLKKVTHYDNKSTFIRSNVKPRTHKVIKGDSLSLIARRYKVSILELKQANQMRSDTLLLDKTLIIP